MFRIYQKVDAYFNGAWYLRTIEDIAEDGYSVCTEVWREKKWFQLSEIRESGNKLPEKEDKIMVVKNTAKVTSTKPVVSKDTDSKAEGTQLVTVASDKKYKVRLGQLITIGQTTIEDAKDAERGLEKSNLDSLLTADEKDLPPIEIQRVVVKGHACWVIVDGKHRRARLVALVEEAYRTSIGKATVDGETGKYIDILDTSEQNALQAKVDDTTIMAKAVNAKDEVQLLQWVYSANNKHGLPTSTRGRAKYALWLIKVAEKNGKTLSRREAAKMAGTTHVAINHFLAAKKRDSEIIDPDTGKPVQKTAEQLERDARTQADKDVRLLVSSIRKVWLDVRDDTPEDAAFYLADFFKPSDGEAIAGLVELLNSVAENLPEESAEDTEEDTIEE